MKFNKNTNKVIVDTLNKEEAKAFILFLKMERSRHVWALHDAQYYEHAFTKIEGEFWQSAAKRHEKDIGQIQDLIEQVRDRFCL